MSRTAWIRWLEVVLGHPISALFRLPLDLAVASPPTRLRSS